MSVNIRKTGIEPSAQGRAGRWWALAALVISGLVIGLDSTVLITALPTLSSKLGATTSDLQWIAAAYTLTLGLIFHAYWLAPAAEARFDRIIFFNHVSIIGGMLAIVAFGAGCLSLDALMRRRS